MTRPELEDFRKELIQTAAVAVAMIEDMDYGIAKVHTTDGDDFIAGRTDLILAEILGERIRQDLKWGPQHHRFSDWLSILGEEYGEACTAYNDNILSPTVEADEKLNPPKPVRWGKANLADYGTPVFINRDDDDHDPNEGRYERQD